MLTSPNRRAREVAPLPRGMAGRSGTHTFGIAVGPRWQRAAVAAVCAVAGLSVAGAMWTILAVLAPVLGLFFGGWLLSCVLEPLVTSLVQRLHVGRPTAIAATYGVVVLALTLAWIGAAPVLASQISTSVADLPSLAEAAAQRALAGQTIANAWLAEHGLGIQLDLASNLSLDSLGRQVGEQLSAAPSSRLAVLSGAVGVLGGIGMVLLLSVFFLLGGRELADQVVQGFGSRATPHVRFVLTAIHDAFDGFVRAQLLQGGMYAAGVWACMAVVQVEGAPLIGATAGVLLLVPVLGAALAVLVPVLATLVWRPQATLFVLAAGVIVQQLVLNVVGPRLMSRRLGLPPLLVLFGVLGGAQVGGFWGAVFGIPVLATLVACIKHFRTRGD